MENTYTATDTEETARSAASSAQEKVSEFGRAAADKFTAATDYFRQHEIKDIATDLNEFVKSHPTQALIGAVAFGFAIATLMRRH